MTWNVIVGIPGEEPGWYATMADRMRLLFHLHPPTGAGEFELHRFSPYFDAPNEYDIVDLGAPDLFRLVFPFGQEIADDLEAIGTNLYFRMTCWLPSIRSPLAG